MHAFIIESAHRPGELAKVVEALAAEKVNVTAAGLGIGTTGATVIIANDEDKARKALANASITAREVSLLVVQGKDRPGELAWLTRKLADADVNVELLLPVDTTPDAYKIALAVSDEATAKQVLGDRITSWTQK